MEASVGRIHGVICIRKDYETCLNEKSRIYPASEASHKYVSKNRTVSSLKIVAKASYRKYGGRIPELLAALKRRKKIEDALLPCEATLDAKDISIILKHQSDCERAVEIFRWFQLKYWNQINVIHYNIVFNILGKAKKWDDLKKFWEEMLRNKVPPTHISYATVIDSYGNAGLKEEAFLWLDRMVGQGLHPDEVIMRTLVNILKKAGEYDKAVQFFQDWSVGKISLPTQAGPHLPLVSISPRKNESRNPCNGDAQVSRPRNPYTYNTLIDTYGKAGRHKEASDLFHDMLKEGVTPNAVTFNTTIHIIGSSGRLDEADALITKMEKLGCTPDTVTYNTLTSLHAENGNVEKASWYFTRMKEVGLIPNAASYLTILKAFAIRNMINEVHIVVQEMDELRVDVHEFSQSAVTSMYIGLGLLNQAWAWFERFHRCGQMSSECYAACMDAYGEQGYWLEAEKVFKCSQEGGRKTSVVEFNVMIKAYGIARLLDKALKLFESMESLGVLPDRCTYSSLIQMFAKSDCLSESKHFLSKMQEQGFISNCGSFSTIIAACGRLGKTADAEEMYKWMLKEEVEADITIYGALIDAFAEAGNLEKAVYYYRIMKDNGFVANSIVYRSLIKMYRKCGLLKEAQETFNMLKKLGDNGGIFSSNCMIDLYVRAGLVTEAQELFQHLKESKKANEFSFSIMLSLYKRIDRCSEAIAIAKEMLNSGFLTDVLSFNNVISLYVTDGRLREAAKVLKKMLTLAVSPNKTTLRILGILLTKGGIPKQTVEQLESYHKDFNMQLLIGTVYSIVGMNDEALEALGPLNELENLNPDLSFYNAIIYALGSAGKIVEASKMLMNMRARGIEPDVTTYTNMIIAYGKLGLVEHVRSMFHLLKQKGFQPDDSTFAAVINAYKSAGKSHMAKIVAQERDYMHRLQEHGNFTHHSMSV